MKPPQRSSICTREIDGTVISVPPVNVAQIALEERRYDAAIAALRPVVAGRAVQHHCDLCAGPGADPWRRCG